MKPGLLILMGVLFLGSGLLAARWLTTAKGKKYERFFLAATRKYGLPAGLLSRVAYQESRYNPAARSPAGAIGLMQFMPATAARFGIDPLQPAQAIDGAGRYLRELYNEFKSWPLALAGYNAGERRVRQYGGVPPFPETQNYVAQISRDVGLRV